MSIILPFREISKCYDLSLLTKTTAVDTNHPRYTDCPWDQWEFEYEKTVFPQLAPPLYFDSVYRFPPVIDLMTKRYKVLINHDDWDEPYVAEGKQLILEEVENLPVTESVGDQRGSEWQVFGQPNFIQNEILPVDSRGKPCYFFLTEWNDWGDMGNWNLFLSFDGDSVPSECYFEASCH